MKRSKPSKRRVPTTADPLLDELLTALEEGPDADNELRQRLHDDPGDADALFDLGLALRDLGRRDDAAAILQRLVGVDPTHSRAWFYLGNVAKDQERWQEALEHFDRAVEHDPDDPSTLHCRGHVHQELGNEVLARDDLRRAIALYGEILDDAPEHAEALFWRGAAAARLGDRDAALADLAAAIALDPYRRQEARDEVDYRPLADDPEFVRLISTKPRRKRR